jgi:hypothetical protein
VAHDHPTALARMVRTAALAALLSLAACASEPPANPYSADVVENFAAGCRRRATEAVCDCALRKIQQKWTEAEFRALEASLGEDAARQIAETVAACAGR